MGTKCCYYKSDQVTFHAFCHTFLPNNPHFHTFFFIDFPPPIYTHTRLTKDGSRPKTKKKQSIAYNTSLTFHCFFVSIQPHTFVWDIDTCFGYWFLFAKHISKQHCIDIRVKRVCNGKNKKQQVRNKTEHKQIQSRSYALQVVARFISVCLCESYSRDNESTTVTDEPKTQKKKSSERK